MPIARLEHAPVDAQRVQRLRDDGRREGLGRGGRDGGVGVVGEEDEREGGRVDGDLTGVGGGVALDGLDVEVALEAAVGGEGGPEGLCMVRSVSCKKIG